MTEKILLVAAFAMLAAAPLLAEAATLTRQLYVGISGTDVSALQAYLATDATLYPQGLVTGYYGFLTKSAVANFQSRNGIEAVGRVGPITLAALNLRMSGGYAGSNLVAPIIGSVSTSTGRNNATVYWATNENAKGVVYYSTSPLTTYEYVNGVTVSGATAMTDANFRTSQGVVLQGLQSDTIYYYLIYTTDQDGNVSVTWPSSFRTTN